MKISTGDRKIPAVRGAIVLAVIAIVAGAAAAVVVGINGYRYWDGKQSEQARAEAVDVASRTVSAIFSYDHETAQDTLPAAAEQLAPDFRDDYLKLIEQAIVPGAKEKQLSVQATGQAGGVVSADRSRAVVLLFLNQVTTSKETPDGTTTGSRVRVELEHTDGHWLVESVTPI